ncbi:hypothetical protein GOBAR_AA19277 [Gossypium barbadense]|uniref:NAB domain-containing protein n=1 Tax=Gossypium barbadense TaxID=3634 RepID=A0A2P5XDH6_GOSBA|nr:hypothetical protein GOBAR_AA19277 [Gossypium barbadense]
MLQRAASNAYSWWWASHIRTKQSKWMEQNLKDIEEKVSIVIKLIDEDGDSFAKRAEMYYKKRPELIQFVEEFYKAYRALAERYDHISTELQNANNTIASVCPEQAQFAMDDDEECGSPKFAKSPVNYKGDVPKVPDLPVKDLKSLITSATKKTEPKKPTKVTTDAVPKSGLTKAEGLEEIHKLQKRILALQTEKQFVKGSYESGLAKYWEIEDEIKALQEKVYSLEDEFGEGKVIEDDEARTLMTAKAIQSCKETLTQMQEKQDRSVVEAEVEQKRIKDAREKLDSLKNKFHLTEVGWERPSDVHNSGIVAERSKKFEQEASDTTQKRKEIETSIPKMKEQFEFGPCESLTVAEMVEKVDELVNKVISLETAFSSQEALIQRLRTETDELQAQIQTLEDDKATLIHVKNDLRNKLMEMEEKFHGIQDLNQSVEDQNNNLQIHFTEAHSNIDHLSEKVHSMKPGEKLEIEKSSSGEAKSSKEEEIGDYGKMPKEVKAGKEFVVEHASERENSPAEVKSSKESEERSNLDASDGCKSLQSAKQAMVVVSDSLSREEDCVVKVSSTKELEERGEKLDHSDGCTKGGDAESEVREDLKLEKREEAEEHDSVRTSTDEGGVHHETSKPSEKCEDLIAENKVDKQPPLLIVDNTLVKVESKEQERRLEDASKGGDTEPKAREDLKREEREEAEEHDSVRTSKNEGGVHQETSKPSEKREDQVAEETVDKQAPLLTVDAVAKVGSKDQERGQEDESKGGDTEPKARGDLKLEEEDAKEHDSVRTSTNEGGVHHETSKPSEKYEDLIAEDKVDKQTPFLTMDAVAKVGSKDQERGEEDEPDWKQLFSKGMGDRERTLLTEYTMALRKYKEVKKKLVEVEANNQNMLFDIMLQLKELKSHNAMKDEEIRSLRQKLNLLQTSIAEINSTDQYVDPRISTEKLVVTETSIAPAHKEEGNEPTVMNQPPTMSAIEAKFRMNIDALLEENLEFWFRFGTAFHEVQKFENGVKDLVGEVSKLGERQKQEGSSTKKYSLKSDVQPLYEHLKEIQHEVTLWVENSASLKEELKKRFSSLCEIQEEITKALKASAEDDDFSFTSYQAVKFQGEILNMKQENNKVADELQAGYNRVTALQIEIERNLAKLSDDWDLSGSKSHQSSEPQQSHSRSGVPLRSFIFGAKLKKQKASIFSFVQPTLHRKFSSSRSGNQ